MPISSNVFNLAFSSAIVVVSSEKGLVTTSVVEDIATVAAVKHSTTETALSRSRHLNMVAQSLPEWNCFVEHEVNRSLFEDLHETLSVSLDLASYEYNHRKASHEWMRGFHDDFQVLHT